MRWPQRIPAGTECSQLASTIDLLPTIAGIIDAKLPSNKIDGKNILALMTEQDAPSPHESLPYYYANHELQAIRDARWKLVFPHTYRTLADSPGGKEGTPANYQTKQAGLELYDLKNDLGESKNVASEHPDIVQRLQKAADAWRDDLGDSLTKRTGQGIRAHGTLLTGDRKLTW
jgi:arylsulfatase A-like enzyme